MHHFFVTPEQVREHEIVIIGMDVNHIKNVLRMKLGEELQISDGNNKKYLCEIESMTLENKRSMLEISELSGFNSISTFNRSFIKIMGQTPSGYYAMQNKACPR